MADPRFFRREGPFSAALLAGIVGGKLVHGDGSDDLCDVAPLDRAGPGDVTFFDNPKYAGQLAACRASLCVIAPANVGRAPACLPLLVTEQPYRAYALIAQAFYPERAEETGIHPSAVIADTAQLGAGVSVGAGAFIGEAAEIGADTRIGANTVIADHVLVGAGCTIGANVSLECCHIGRECVIQPGAVIGPGGFGFAPDAQRHTAVPQLGRVIIGDYCHVGANTTIARGTLGDTVIGDNVWIDNLVQIAHNVEIGAGSIIVSQVGISGSTKLGRFVTLAGQVGLAGHLNIGDGVTVGAKSGLMHDIPAGETWMGSPAMPKQAFWRLQANLRRLINKGRKK